jgi:hypothetical protein
MAVNKNFAIKNGLEVNADLIFANATTRKVGIGTSNPRYNLDVRGGIGATDVIVSGIVTVLNELRVGTSGTIFTVIAGPTGFGQSVGVGTANPAFLLDVRSPVSTGQTALYVKGDARITGNVNLEGDINIDEITVRNINATGIATLATLGVSGVTTSQHLQVIGVSTLGITSATNLTAQQLNVSGLSTFAGITTVTGETLFSKQLNVSGITTLGVTTVTNLTAQQINVSGLSTFAGITTVTGETLFSKQLNVSGVSTLPTLSGTTVTYTTGNFTTGNIVTGIVTTLTSTNATLTNINSSGITTLGVTSTTNLTAQQLNVSWRINLCWCYHSYCITLWNSSIL